MIMVGLGLLGLFLGGPVGLIVGVLIGGFIYVARK